MPMVSRDLVFASGIVFLTEARCGLGYRFISVVTKTITGRWKTV